MKTTGKRAVLCVCFSLSLFLTIGCGGKPTSPTAPSQDELADYLSNNPDVANEDAPEVEAE